MQIAEKYLENATSLDIKKMQIKISYISNLITLIKLKLFHFTTVKESQIKKKIMISIDVHEMKKEYSFSAGEIIN